MVSMVSKYPGTCGFPCCFPEFRDEFGERSTRNAGKQHGKPHVPGYFTCNRAVFHDLAGLSRLGRVFFLCGMPNDVGVELQQIMNIETVEMEHVISRARILVTNRLEPVIAASGIRHSGAAKEQCQKNLVGLNRNNQAELKGFNVERLTLLDHAQNEPKSASLFAIIVMKRGI